MALVMYKRLEAAVYLHCLFVLCLICGNCLQLYTVTTSVLYVQSIYYGHIYPRLKNRRDQMVYYLISILPYSSRLFILRVC